MNSHLGIIAVILTALTALAGCGTPVSPGAPATEAAPVETPSNVEPPRPRRNLSGFPLPYRQGYDDGCNSAAGVVRKDEKRFAKDANYRMGWQDGLSLCTTDQKAGAGTP